MPGKTTTIDALERLWLEGKVDALKAALEEVDTASLSRDERARVAGLFRRVRDPMRALRLLHRYVRPEKGKRRDATVAEIAEYAGALNSVGRYREAHSLFEELPADVAYGQAHALRCALYHNLNDAPRALKAAEAWVACRDKPGFGGEWHTLARIYVISTLPSMPSPDLARMRALIEECLGEHDNREGGPYPMRRFDLLLQKTMMHTRSGELSKAAETLERMAREKLVTGAVALENLALCWRGFVGMMRATSEQERDAAWVDVAAARRAFSAAGLAPRVRALDKNLALMFGMQRPCMLAYFGSPLPSLRARLETEIRARGWELPETFAYRLDRLPGDRGREPARIDVTAPAGLKPGMLTQRLLLALARDFYRPRGLYELHEAIYPNERFQPESTPAKFHQALKGLREWIDESGVALEVRESDGLYTLASKGRSATLELSREVLDEDDADLSIDPVAPRAAAASASASVDELTPREKYQVRQLLERCRDREFTQAEAREILDVATRSAQRLLTEAVKAGQLEREGSGRGVRYRFKKAA